MTCQRVANDFSAHGSAWQLTPQNTEQKISPRGGLRPLIGLSPVTALPNTEHWSHTNGEERESLLFLETEENERWPPFWRYLNGTGAKLERYIRSQQRRMADIQTDNNAHC